MRFQLHLAWAHCHSNTGNVAQAERNLQLAEGILKGLEEAEAPPAPSYWVLRKKEETALRYLGMVGGASAFCTEDSEQITRFPTQGSADAYARHLNLWRILESVRVLPPIEPLT